MGEGEQCDDERCTASQVDVMFATISYINAAKLSTLLVYQLYDRVDEILSQSETILNVINHVRIYTFLCL